MISIFSEAGYLMRRPPHPRACFFEQAVLEGEIGHHLLEGSRLPAQASDLVRGRLAGDIAGQALLAGLQEVLGPAVVHIGRDALAAAELSDAVLTAQAFQHDADLLLGGVVLAGGPSDLLDHLLSRLLGRSWFLSHRLFL
jgi:hypothetical protein